MSPRTRDCFWRAWFVKATSEQTRAEQWWGYVGGLSQKNVVQTRIPHPLLCLLVSVSSSAEWTCIHEDQVLGTSPVLVQRHESGVKWPHRVRQGLSHSVTFSEPLDGFNATINVD